MAPSGGPCVTSPEAYTLAVTLCEEYERRKTKEKELNVRKEAGTKKKAEQKEEGPSRTVTEIDYNKHEETVKELARQEKEEAYNRKKVEAAQWCTLDHEHGPHCRRTVPGCSHDHQKEWQIYEKSTEEKIGAAERFRQEGNEAYRKHNYGLAAVHYRKALLQFDYTFADNDEEEKAIEEVKVPCLLNLAACKCQQEEWDEVLTQCRLALEINPRSVKAFYRTGLAHLARDKFDLAKDALWSAHEIEPHNREVRGGLEQLKKKMGNYKVRRKEVFREMMVGGASGEEGVAAETLASEVAAVPPPPPPPPYEATAAATASPPGGAACEAEAAVETPRSSVTAATGVVAAASPAATMQTGEESRGAPSHGAPPPPDVAALRRRRPAVGAGREPRGEAEDQKDGIDEDSDRDDEETLGLLNGSALNYILIVAACLALMSIIICVLLAFSSAEG